MSLAVTVLVALVVGWVLGMMTAACLGWHRYVKHQEGNHAVDSSRLLRNGREAQ